MKSKCSVWQSDARRCNVVLREVFSWLGGRDLAQASASCRAWRSAANDPLLWRHLILREGLAEPSALLYLHNLRKTDTVSWRHEYVTACTGWRLEEQHIAAGGATLLHAALSPAHDALAIGADDASLAIWRHVEGRWREVYRTELRARGWSCVARVEWARHSSRLLLAGPRALIDDWELMVLCLDDDYGGATVASRVRCSAGAAGCWADAAGDAFLSLELRLLAPRLACTTLRLNAATQETQSEYAGVTVPLLRIFNEDCAHITHVALAVMEEGRRVLVASMRCRLGAWPVVEPRPPPLLVGAAGELAERVRRHRARAAVPDEEPPEPDEASVRALCAPPDLDCVLTATIIGITLDDTTRCLWAVCADGSVTCVCVRTFVPLYCVRAGGGASELRGGHYVQPAVTDQYVVSPEGGFSPRVWVWSLRSGAAAQFGGGNARGIRIRGDDESGRNIIHNGGDNIGDRDGNNHRLDAGHRDDSDNRLDAGNQDGNDQHLGAGDLNGDENRSNAGGDDNRNAELNNEEQDVGEHDGNVEHDSNDHRKGTGDHNGGSELRDDEEQYENVGSDEYNNVTEHDGNLDRGDNVKLNGHTEHTNDEESVESDYREKAVVCCGDSVLRNSEEPIDSEHIEYDVSDRGGNDDDDDEADDVSEHDSGNGSEANSEGVNGDTPDVGNEDEQVMEAMSMTHGEARHGGAAVCALVARGAVLTLAHDTLYVWRRRAPAQLTPTFYE